MTSDTELAKLQQLATNQTVLELGSLVGRSATAMAETAKIVHAVDWFGGDPHAGEHDSLPDYLTATRHIPNIITHIGRFQDVLPVLALHGFNVIFIDGYHTAQQVTEDIRLALPLLAPRGVMAFHDYGLKEFGVTQAVNEFCSPIEVVETLAIVKPDARQIRRAA